MLILCESDLASSSISFLGRIRYIAVRQATKRHPAECRVVFVGSPGWVDISPEFGNLIMQLIRGASRRVGYVDWPFRATDVRQANWYVESVYAGRLVDVVPDTLNYLLESGRFDFDLWLGGIS